MKIEKLVEKYERKGFFGKVKNLFRPRNWVLAGALLYTTLAPLNCSKEDKPFIQPNRPPEITNVTYEPGATIDENSLLKLIVDVTDPDGDTPEITINGAQDGAQFLKASEFEFIWIPNYTQGEVGGKQYDFKITADDQKGGIDTELISVFVNDLNRPPVLDPIADITVNENDLVQIIATGTDPDNDTLTFSYTPPLDVNGEWQTDYNDSGAYQTTVTADDGKGGLDSQLVNIIVNDLNRPPVLDFIPDITVDENALVQISPTATDPDNDPLTFSYTPPLDTIGQWQTDYNDSGAYSTTVSVDDGRGGSDSQLVNIIVNDVLFKIAYESALGGMRPGPPDIYKMDPDGSNQINLTNTSADEYLPAISPDGTKIAFQLRAASGCRDICIMNKDGSNQINLTNNGPPNWNDSEQPAWSPDGQKIAYMTWPMPNWDSEEIYKMNADGSNPTRLTNNFDQDDQPAWSPDGQKIAFRTDRDGNYEIYVMNADGSNQTRLTNNSLQDQQPAWSPDGTKIAFARRLHLGSNQWDIYKMNADGSNQINLTNTGTTSGSPFICPAEQKPTWSPDGTKIAYQYRAGGQSIAPDEIYIMNADGSNQTNLTNDNTRAEMSPHFGRD